MKKLITTDITTGVGFPVKSGTLDFIQAAYAETLSALAQNIVGSGYDITKFYRLFGCENSDTAPDYIISAGALFFNGVIYLVPAATFTAGGGETAVGTITTAYQTAANADPVTFTDGTPRSVHEIKTVVFDNAVSGTGDIDFDDILDTQLTEVQVIDSGTLTKSADWTGSLSFQRSGNVVTINGLGLTWSGSSGTTATTKLADIPAEIRSAASAYNAFAVYGLDIATGLVYTVFSGRITISPTGEMFINVSKNDGLANDLNFSTTYIIA